MEKLQKPLEPLIQMLPYLKNMDLSNCQIEDRKAIFDEAYRRLNKEIEVKTTRLQQEETKRSEERTSFRGKLRHLFGLDKKELEEEARKQEEHDKKEKSIKGLIMNPNAWTWQRREAADGLYYKVGETSVKGKTDEEIKLMQKKLREFGIGTQFVTDNDSNDRVLLVSDPVSKKNVEGWLSRNAQIHDGIDKEDVPLTKEEYAAELQEEREKEKERGLEKRKCIIKDTLEIYFRDPSLVDSIGEILVGTDIETIKIMARELKLKYQGKPSIFDMINRPAHASGDNTVVAEGESTYYQSGTLSTHAKSTPGTVAPSEASSNADQGIDLKKMLEERRSKGNG